MLQCSYGRFDELYSATAITTRHRLLDCTALGANRTVANGQENTSQFTQRINENQERNSKMISQVFLWFLDCKKCSIYPARSLQEAIFSWSAPKNPSQPVFWKNLARNVECHIGPLRQVCRQYNRFGRSPDQEK